MSDIIQELFCLAMDKLPYVPNPAKDKAEKALEEILDQDGKRLLHAYNEASDTFNWEDMKYIFYTGLSLGIELATLKPSANASHR